MLSKHVRATLTVLALCGAVAAVQAQQSQPPTQQPTEQRASQQPVTTLTGCVYREQDVPGRAPNAAERVGILEDYILAEISTSGQPGTPSATGTTGTGEATGTAGTGATAAKPAKMYKLEFASDEQLKALVGKRVQVSGRIDAEPGDAKARPGAAQTSETDKVIGRDRVNLPEFEVTSIQEVSGTCPAKPTGASDKK